MPTPYARYAARVGVGQQLPLNSVAFGFPRCECPQDTPQGNVGRERPTLQSWRNQAASSPRIASGGSEWSVFLAVRRPRRDEFALGGTVCRVPGWAH